MNNKSNVQILTGVNGIKNAYLNSLLCKTLDIICLSQNYERIIGNFFKEEYAPKLYNGTIKTREILPDTADNRECVKSKNSTANEVRFINTQCSESDMLISENRITLVSYDQNEPYAVEITDKELLTIFKMQFEVLWKSLE